MRIDEQEASSKPLFEEGLPVVYAVRAGPRGPIKLGRTNDLPRRVSELQVGCPDELVVLLSIPADPEDESWLLQRFASARRRGEWFEPTEELLSWVEAARCTRSLR